jgi:hypothetical protein
VLENKQKEYLTIDVETSHYRVETVSLLSSLAVFARMAHILNRFEPCSLANLEVLDSFSYLDDDTCAFVTSTLGAKLRPGDRNYVRFVCETSLNLHWRQTPVLHHEVDI